MKSFRIWMSVLLLLGFVLAAVRAGDDDAEEILSNLRDKYDSIHDASVSFTQHVEFGVTKVEQTFTGKLLMKKGNKYRIEMEQQTIVTDGKSVWSFNKPNNQVLIDKFTDDPNSITPDKLLVNVPDKYSTTLLGSEKLDDRPLAILKLVPKTKGSTVQWMKVWVDTDDWLMKKVQVLDLSDNLTTFIITDIRINPSIPDSQFRFTPPEGVDVIDLR
jgi:outer membrane lipoprotein carrier protein